MASAWRAFCSIIRIDTPALRKSFRIEKTSWTIRGDRPIEGSSISISLGSSKRPRATSRSFCWPPDRVEAGHWPSRATWGSAPSSRPCGRRAARCRLSATPPNSRLCAPRARGRDCGPAARRIRRHRACGAARTTWCRCRRRSTRPVRTPKKPEHRLEQGRLAGAVGADHRGDGAAADGGADAVQDRHLAVAGDDAVEGEDGIGSYLAPCQCPR